MLEEVEEVPTPTTLQEALREVVKWLDIGDDAVAIVAVLQGHADPDYYRGREVQEDLLAVADFLDHEPQGVGQYIWEHRHDT